MEKTKITLSHLPAILKNISFKKACETSSSPAEANMKKNYILASSQLQANGNAIYAEIASAIGTVGFSN